MLNDAPSLRSAGPDRTLVRTVVRLALFQADDAREPGFVSPETPGAPLSRVLCLVGNHDFAVHCAPGNIHLRCSHCGARTRGWDIGAPRFKVTPPEPQFTLTPLEPRIGPATTALEILPLNRSLVLSESARRARRGESHATG